MREAGAEWLDRLIERGFAIVPGPFAEPELDAVAASYDHFVGTGTPRYGSRSLRTTGLARVRSFDPVLTHPLLWVAAQRVVGADFRLSAYHTRSLIPGTDAPPLHRDVERGRDGWPLLGFILMVDAFSPENGATRYIAGSHREGNNGSEQTLACGAAGSLILFNGSVLHDHGANQSSNLRRSVQGAIIPRHATPAVVHADHLAPSDGEQLPSSLRYLFGL